MFVFTGNPGDFNKSDSSVKRHSFINTLLYIVSMAKYYCFRCGRDIVEKKVDSIGCFKCNKKGARIKSGKIDGRTYYYLADVGGYIECGHKTFKKSAFRKTKRIELHCPIHGKDPIRIEKGKSPKRLRIKTRLKVTRKILCSHDIVLTKNDYIAFFGFSNNVMESEIIRRLQLKSGDRLEFVIRKIT